MVAPIVAFALLLAAALGTWQLAALSSRAEGGDGGDAVAVVHVEHVGVVLLDRDLGIALERAEVAGVAIACCVICRRSLGAGRRG